MELPVEPRKRRSRRKRAEQTAQTLIAALLLGTASGCATLDQDYPRAPLTNARPAVRPLTVVTVQKGDTLNAVARRYNISQDTIIQANGLRSPYRLTRGQRLVLPPPPPSASPYLASRGEPAYPVARNYATQRRAVITTNELPPPQEVKPAPRLANADLAPQQKATQQVTPKAKPTMKPVVEAGDDVKGLDPRVEGARYYALGTPREKPLPDGQGGPEEFAPPQADKAPKAAIAKTQVVAAKTQLVATRDLDAAYDEKPVKAKTIIDTSGDGGAAQFIWPVRGKLLSGYGRRETGQHNDGINIAAEPGTEVKAADSGIVVYAGNELAGYGNLLLIRHPSGYVTAYAHNRKILVERGTKVKQGETVALVGSTGDVDRPQLHFEIRKGDRAVDPNKYLTRATASR